MSKSSQKIQWRFYGDAQLPPIVLLTGLGMPARAWPETFVSALIQEGFCVYTPENRDALAKASSESFGLGRLLWAGLRYRMHRKVHAPYSLEDMASDVEAFMDEAGLERAHIVGISMGGMIAQAFACQAPHRTNSLACLSTTSGNPGTMLKSYTSLISLLKLDWKTSDPEGKKRLLKTLRKALGSPSQDWALEETARLLKVMEEIPNVPGGAVRQLMAIMGSGDRRERLCQLRVPTLVVHGSEDPLLPIAAGEELSKLIEGARFLAIEGMGHVILECDTSRIVKAIAANCARARLR